MKRLRKVAAAPTRRGGEAWQTISDLVADTLERSDHIDRARVEETMETAGGIGRQLISGGHLRKKPLVLVAGDMYLEIEVISGDGAFALEENLAPVPGAAGVSEWTLHLPQVEPLAKSVRKAAKEDEHLSAEEPKQKAAEAAEAVSLSASGSGLNEAALAEWAEERR